MSNRKRIAGRRPPRRGFFWAEVIAAIPILGLMTVLAGAGILNFYRFRSESVTRQTTAWAAAAQLERLQAGAGLDSQPPPGLLPPGVILETAVTAGEGPWSGFQLVTVTASVAFNDRDTVRERVSGYVRREAAP